MNFIEQAGVRFEFIDACLDSAPATSSGLKIGSTRLDILRFFRIAGIFALSSFVEGLPIALLEGMALGIPSISTRINGIPEAIKHMETGILIEAGDSGWLASFDRAKGSHIL